MSNRWPHGDDGIAEDGKIGPAADTLDGVLGVRVAVIEMGSGRGGQMTAGRETPDPDSLWIEVPLHWPAAHETQSTLDVLHWCGVMIPRSQAIAQDKRGYAQTIQPVCRILALVADRQRAIPAARTHNNSGPIGFVRWRKLHGESRFIALLGADRARSPLGPEQLNLGLFICGTNHQS